MWNPSCYDTFNKERRQPSIDLANRVMQINPHIHSILDIGCGSGLSTLILMQMWPLAKITGADYSVNMLEKAKKRLPDVDFILKDCSTAENLAGNYDLIFSNAFLQWIGQQENFIKDIKSHLAESGILAMQIPGYENMAVAKCVQKATASFGKLQEKQPEKYCFTYDPADYYNMFSSCYSYVEMWETIYFHQMKNHMDIVEFINSTALAPYLDILEEKYHQQFKEIVLYYIKQAYPVQQNSIILFPFRRTFIIAAK